MPAEDLDDEYHEYLWGEASPRAFARRCKSKGTDSRRPTLEVQVGATVSLADVVPR